MVEVVYFTRSDDLGADLCVGGPQCRILPVRVALAEERHAETSVLHLREREGLMTISTCFISL